LSTATGFAQYSPFRKSAQPQNKLFHKSLIKNEIERKPRKEESYHTQLTNKNS